MARHIRYLGFAVHPDYREYTLAMRGTDAETVWHHIAVCVPLAAFQSRRVRYQDAPDLCFRVLHQEAESHLDWVPPPSIWLNEEDFKAYAAATAARRPLGRHRPRPAPAGDE